MRTLLTVSLLLAALSARAAETLSPESVRAASAASFEAVSTAGPGLAVARPGMGKALKPAVLPSWTEALDKLVEKFRHAHPAQEKGVAPQAVAAPVAKFPLAGALDAYWNTALSFKTAAGDTVHASGIRALNCPNGDTCDNNEKYFLIFHSDRGQTYFVKGTEIANVPPFMSGKKDLLFAGDDQKYTVRLYVSLSDSMSSRVNVQYRGKPVLETTVGKLLEAVQATGADVKLGRAYKVYYGSEVRQNPQGQASTGTDKIFVFIPLGQLDQFIMVQASKVPTGAPAEFPELEKGYGLKLAGEVLEFYKL